MGEVVGWASIKLHDVSCVGRKNGSTDLAGMEEETTGTDMGGPWADVAGPWAEVAGP